jgi:2-polyprenyl-3-methyl-5-hydroxy-6-metoxy-1,4-benzoquinol methylase
MKQPHKTAIKRKKLSTPMQYLGQQRVFNGKMLDYGCGYGNDAQLIGMDKYDPHFHPTFPYNKQYDTITCNYVLNVVNGEEQVRILNRIHGLLTTTGKAYISVRNDLKLPQQPGRGCIQVQVHLNLPIVAQNGNFKMYLLTKDSNY